MNEADYIGADGCNENGKKFISHEIQSPLKIYKGTGQMFEDTENIAAQLGLPIEQMAQELINLPSPK